LDNAQHLNGQGAPAHGPVISEVEAKQGRKGTHTFKVLAVSLLLVVLAFGALYALSARPLAPPQPRANPASNPYHDPANP